MGDAAGGPDVSVLVSTRNRAALLVELFAALERQDFAGEFEVVVTDDGSTDDTPTRLTELAAGSSFPVRVVRRDHSGGPAVGRNAAAQHARSEILAFTDDDCRPAPGWLTAGVSAMERGRHVVVGAVIPPADADSGPLRRPLWVLHWRFFECANVFYRRRDFEAVGGFDSTFSTVGGEDTDLGLRVCKDGAEPWFEPDAVVEHPLRVMGTKDALREAVRWYDVPLLFKRHPEQRLMLLGSRVFWRDAHRWWSIGFVLALVAAVAKRPALAVLAYSPWLWRRCLRPYADRADALRAAPTLFLVDGAEMATMLRGSVRHRTFLL